ncbi:LysR family transcriptional regulator [Nocardia sp. NBC_01503]|uniref:LysR family transcriptional regulator n=1 Tax=Nocardia sp. NBC_01503 TaxID=2975997 RepID=UPI002E7B97AD|nr:LysR family transcriptional regulator [Nocardia sp. NBC_01503]WTL33227.1 LysR family transcriptional regulator [Nocardia sp. NBC_01503]
MPQRATDDRNDVELRDIEIFLTLADELHFGRTAQRLRVTPASITKAIKKQEREIGAALFERTSRSVRLTPIGKQLRDSLRPSYLALRACVQQAQTTARGSDAGLCVGLMPYNTSAMQPYWQEFRNRHPQWELQIRRPAVITDPLSALRDDSIDALIVWTPILEPDLTVGPVLFSDTRALAVAADHELAQRGSLPAEDLADVPHIIGADWPEYWENAYLPFHTPGGRPIPRSAYATSPDDALALIAAGELVHLFPAHVTEYWSLPDIRFIPVLGLPRLPYALVWRTDAENERTRALARVIRDLSEPTERR